MAAIRLRVDSRIAERLRRGVGFNLLAAVFGQGSTLLVGVIVARTLGREQYGRFSLVQSTLLTLALLAQVGTGYTATRYLAELRTRDSARAGRVLRLCGLVAAATAVIAGLALVLVSPWLASSYFDSPELAQAFRVAAITVIALVVASFATGALSGLEEYRWIAGASVFGAIVYTAGCAVGAKLGGVVGAIAGTALAWTIQMVVLLIAVRYAARAHGLTAAGDPWSEKHVLHRFAIPGALSGLTALPALWLANAALARSPNGYTELALYSAAFTFRSAVIFIPSVMNGVVMSVLNHERGRGDAVSSRALFRLNLIGTSLTALFVAGSIALFAPWILAMFGSAFAGARAVLWILMGAAVFEALVIAMNQLVQAHERMWLAIGAINLPRDLTLVVLSFALAPTLGARGVAVAYAISWGLALVAIAIIARRLAAADHRVATASVGPLPSDAAPVPLVTNLPA
jgi:O-antigen/teichoic acid export membrane protein